MNALSIVMLRYMIRMILFGYVCCACFSGILVIVSFVALSPGSPYGCVKNNIPQNLMVNGCFHFQRHPKIIVLVIVPIIIIQVYHHELWLVIKCCKSTFSQLKHHYHWHITTGYHPGPPLVDIHRPRLDETNFNPGGVKMLAVRLC
jgi:hypothetical protein